MIISILALIIIILIGFIIWLLQFLNSDTNTEMVQIQNKTPVLAINTPQVSKSSIIGKSKNKTLKPIPKGQKVVATEDLNDIFLNNEFEEEYFETNDINNSPKDEIAEVLIIDKEGNTETIEENRQLEKTSCLDYGQLLNTTRKIINDAPLDIDDAQTISKLEGTSIASQLEKAMPNYLLKVRQALAQIDY